MPALYPAFFFRPRKRLEKRRKRSHINASNASVIRTSRIFQAPLQTPLPCFHQWVKLVLAQSSAKRPTFAFTGESGYTLGFRRKIAHNGLHTDTSRTFTNIPGPGVRTAYFAPFGSRSRVLPKNAESLRDSDALMRVAVPRRRGPAGLRDLFSFLSKLRFSHSVLRAFRGCETWEVSLSSACFACF